jgi:hypothetical protein
MEKENARADSLPTSRGHVSICCFRDVLRFSFALDLKSEIKQELFYKMF